ncbi:MAG TPA: HEAT repeat domain-containing protein [Candidatus Limnocylindrales bacterium]|nr:HEAT repeat domain-containing protein [Candidatus Limnocylindrales bacterium]
MPSNISESLTKFRNGDEEAAFYDLLELPGELLVDLIDEFRKEQESNVRALLIKVAWERRENGVLPFLTEALAIPDELVWQQALDGLVAFASQEVRKILLGARTREFAETTMTNRFHLWLEEAIQQVEFELRAKT